MIYMADTADIAALKHLYEFFPLEGITTNPTILKMAGQPLSLAVDQIKAIVGDGMINIQVMSENADDIVREAKKYKTYFDLGDNYYSKIPGIPQGYKALSILKDAGINVTATAIFTQQQALVAAKAGADFVAPYVSRLDNISSHGIDVVGDIAKNIIEHVSPMAKHVDNNTTIIFLAVIPRWALSRYGITFKYPVAKFTPYRKNFSEKTFLN